MSKKKSFLHNGDAIVFMDDDYYNGRLFNTYSLIAKNRFRWKGLPKEIEQHHIEEFLFSAGQVAVFKDEEMGGYLALPCHQSGALNVYGEPLSYQVTGHGYSKQIDSDKMVRIKSNDECYPAREQVAFYTKWIDDIERTMVRNLRQLRQPYIAGTDKDNELAMKNVVKQIENGEEAIYVQKDKGYNGEIGIHVAQLGVQNQLDPLQKNKNDVMYELLTFLGINNANTSKKERMITDEVNVNNINILMNLDFEYKCRQDACKLMKDMFGWNVEVELVIEELESEHMQIEGNDSKKDGVEKEVI